MDYNLYAVGYKQILCPQASYPYHPLTALEDVLEGGRLPPFQRIISRFSLILLEDLLRCILCVDLLNYTLENAVLIKDKSAPKSA